MDSLSAKKFGRNVGLSVSAQIVSMLVSFVLVLIVPKFIDEIQYSYWQLFLLFLSYVGLCHFGLLDGIMLRYSRYDYEELDRHVFHSQFTVLSVLLLICSFIVIGCSNFVEDTVKRKILLLISIAIVTKNIATYTSFTFQLTNRISRYALFVILQRLVAGILVVILLATGCNNFVYYCLTEIISDAAVFLVTIPMNRGMYFGKCIPFRQAIHESAINIKSGCKILLSAWASIFIIGSLRLIVEHHWDIVTFGKLSFSSSLLNFFMVFVTAVSVVVFPSLKRIKEERLGYLYNMVNDILYPFFFIILALYYPISYLVVKWLPNYAESLEFMGIMFPIIIFATKMSLLANNYLKAYRRENDLFRINMLYLLLAIGLFLLCTYLFDNIYVLLVILNLVLFGVARSSEKVLSGVFKIESRYKDIEVLFIVACFIASTYIPGNVYGFLAYLLVLTIFTIIHRRDIASAVKRVRIQYDK